MQLPDTPLCWIDYSIRTVFITVVYFSRTASSKLTATRNRQLG